MDQPAVGRPDARRVSAWLKRFVADQGGQDLIEYALLSAVIGLVALATMNALGITIGTVYSGLNTAVNGLWEAPAPPS
jgi:pilus assembly protein Flp/PilA